MNRTGCCTRRVTAIQSVDLSAEHRLAAVSALTDQARYCTYREKRLRDARGNLGAFLKKVALQHSLEKQ